MLGRLMLAGVLLPFAAGHGAVTIPPPRQAIDEDLSPWNGSVPDLVPFEFWCAFPTAAAVGKDPRNVSGANGQACFWFSNGCDISCDACDGSTGQAIWPTFVYTGAGTVPSWGGDGIELSPQSKAKAYRRSICPNPKRNATICDPRLRTINTNAECGSPEDLYYYAPWRSPGVAPVIDACGAAGGRLPGQGPGAAGADYQETFHAKRGDVGSKLPRRPSGTVWTVGDAVEVAWTQKAFHGGGYQYRLCPASAPLTEKCFQQTPLDFVGQSSLRWGGSGGKRIFFEATDVSEGTWPEKSTWRKGPIPRAPWGWVNSGASFEPKCDEPPACVNAHYRNPGETVCNCSGWSIGDLYRLEVVDRVRIPSDLAPGEYVLGWRWDCEESTQVWSSCSDVTIKR